MLYIKMLGWAARWLKLYLNYYCTWLCFTIHFLLFLLINVLYIHFLQFFFVFNYNLFTTLNYFVIHFYFLNVFYNYSFNHLLYLFKLSLSLFYLTSNVLIFLFFTKTKSVFSNVYHGIFTYLFSHKNTIVNPFCCYIFLRFFSQINFFISYLSTKILRKRIFSNWVALSEYKSMFVLILLKVVWYVYFILFNLRLFQL